MKKLRVKVIDLINEWMSESILYEQAYRRRKAKEEVLHLGSTFSLHLLKVLTMPENESFRHWIKELNGYCFTLNKLFLKPNKKKLEGNIYYELLFVGPIGGKRELRAALDHLNREYDLRVPNKQVQADILEELERIIHKLSYDFANDTYTGNIEDYINEHNIR